jgi:outer membrane protein assembly factor BamB
MTCRKKPIHIIIALRLHNSILVFLLLLFNVSCSTTNKQENCTKISHELPPDTKLNLLWEVADLYVLPDDVRPMIVGTKDSFNIIAERSSEFNTKLLSLNSLSGVTEWEKTVDVPSPIVIDGENLLLGQYEKLYIFYDNQYDQSKILNLDGIGNFLYMSLNNDYLYAFTSGNKSLKVDLSDLAFNITENNNLVIPLSEESGIIYAIIPYADLITALDHGSTKIVWETDIHEHFITPLFSDEEIIVSTGNSSSPGKIFSINKADGNINWMKYTKIISNLAALDGKIFYLDENGYLVELNKSNGSEVARFMISPEPFILRKAGNNVGGYFIGVDEVNDVIAISLGDSCQIFSFRLPADK